ncbi:unnamed protein product [Caenorhabditis bovis]|uniref:maleylacetoacetate isomerase n=1 Tax=Caenorhabditis bovis TaxID=2654633 RepID=A0A8S1EI92_9PELO|nr:unnamed protein product [Caenorhabditis bovis]
MSDSEKPILYSYWRSSCAWRVRIALNLKGIDYEYRTVNLLSKEALDDLSKYNPARLVPVLVVKGQSIAESLAIIDYLEDVYPEKSLHPKDPILKARAKAIFLHVACGIQPLQNLKVLQFVNQKTPGYGSEWSAHWITLGLNSLEEMLKKGSGKYCVGDEITVADLAIPSIVYNAKRFGVPLTNYPNITRIDEALGKIPEFQKACPDAQPDAGLNAK